MVFQSWYYFLFLIGLGFVQVFLKAQHRWILLLLGSLFFYSLTGWSPLILLLSTIFLTYGTAKWLYIEKKQNNRYRILLVSVITQVVLLGIFKYLGFLNDLIDGLSVWWNAPSLYHFPLLMLPLGISFYTFQSMGYVFDVYYKIRKPEEHLGHYALFVSFFPQIQSGPIGRSKEMLPQWKSIDLPKWETIRMALLLFVWGLLKKFVIADRLGVYVDEVYDAPDQYDGIVWMFILFLYTIQLYADFSAYSDMAIASASVLGIQIPENFQFPYKANNITDFWRRWHLSLSGWLRDYIYTPLLFSKKKWKKWAVIYAIAVTFVICGIWHGPKMTFVIFGFVQAFLLIYEMQSKDWRAKLANRIPKRWYQAMSVLLTFVLISFCFILFRANDLSAVINIFSSISRWDATQAMLYLREKNGTTIVGLLITLFLFLWMDEGISQRIREKKSKSKTLSLLLAMMVVMIMLGMVLGKEQFIYFQF
jgi:D-alanyl-lipoteichoic acid acyltransferase DltB (MBOAT superfamily)